MRNKRVILIIEHNATVVQHLLRALEQTSYEVLVAERAIEGLDVARRHQPNLIITNLSLPDMSGFELAATLRADPGFAQMPIIAIGRDFSMTVRDRAFAAGMTGFLDTPIKMEALTLQLEFYLSGGTDGIDDTQRMHVARDRLLQEVVKRLETQVRELEDRNARLHDLDAMKEKFISLTAHELRTPLTLVTGYHRLLVDYDPITELTASDPAMAELVTGLNEAIDRMQVVIDEVLAFSRIMTNEIRLEIRPTYMAQVIEQAIERFQSAIDERNITIHYDAAHWPAEMRADAALIALTFENLLSNAIKATPDSGHIYLAARAKDDWVRMVVRDTGVGIKPEDQVKIFEHMHIVGEIGLHSTSKTAFGGGGLGLGLAICRGIVEAHGGTIKVKSPVFDSANYPGSEFIITMPLVPKGSGMSASLVSTG